jgi:hypothetical protein
MLVLVGEFTVTTQTLGDGQHRDHHEQIDRGEDDACSGRDVEVVTDE